MNVVVIPARGGSKGLPRKNIKEIYGKPLIVWSILAAKAATLVDRVIVSTNCQDIAAISTEAGAEVQWRPEELASDTAKTIDVISHVASQVGAGFKNFVVLQPTSPLRHKTLIDDCINYFNDGNYSNLATGFWCHYREFGTHLNEPRQNYKGFFYDDGSVYILNKHLVETKQWFGDKICKYENTKCQTFEIDDIVDFVVVESLFREVNINPSLYDIR